MATSATLLRIQGEYSLDPPPPMLKPRHPQTGGFRKHQGIGRYLRWGEALEIA